MLKLSVKALWFIAALALSGAACAVGMGGINVTTALGEPLKAEIQLMAVGKAEKNSISARLASPEAFKLAGLDYPGSLPRLKFQIEERANGESYIKVTSAQVVNEPFVSLLVELSWSSGQLLREYTFLLDPPGFKPEQPKAVEVQPLEPSVASPDESRAGAVKEQPMPMRASAPMDEKAFARAGITPAKQPAGSSNFASGTITVKRGDTLSKIAIQTKSSDVSLERMMVAMYQANEDAFDGNNMNRLKVGKILRVPEGDDLSKVGQVDALKEIRVQAADWHAYRMKLAAASRSVSEQAPKQESSGKISTTVADKTPAAKESAKEVVRLSKGQAPGDKDTAGGNSQAMQEKLHAMEEDATARSKTLMESNARIAILEKNIHEMQRLLELKGQPLPSAKSVQGKAEEPVSSKADELKTKPEIKPEVKPEAIPVAESAVAALVPAAQPASAVKPIQPAMPKVVTPPPSLLDEIMDEPLYLAAGAAALLGLGGLGFMRARRSKGKEDEDSLGTHIAAPIAPSPDTGDFTKTAFAAPISPAEPEDVDPISEADLFLNFGRDVQAEEILKEALKNNPGNQQIRLKLLSIYAKRKDTKTFAGVAREVQNSGDVPAWEQAAAMGRKLEPGNSMYGSDDSAVAGEAPLEEGTAGQHDNLDFDVSEAGIAAADMPVGTASAAPSGLDFDLNFDAPATVASSAPEGKKTDTSTVLDFDLGFDEPTGSVAPANATAGINYENTVVLNAPVDQENMATENSQAAQDTTLDFDLTAEHIDLSAQQPAQSPEQAAEPEPSSDDLVFDVTSTQSFQTETIEEQASSEASAKADDVIDFTLDFPVTEESPAGDNASPAAPDQTVANQAGIIDMSEINLNLDAPVSAPAEEVKDARWHDVATKLDLARAYQEMGDASGAREILEEVLNEGDAQQRAAAEVMLQQLSA